MHFVTNLKKRRNKQPSFYCIILHDVFSRHRKKHLFIWLFGCRILNLLSSGCRRMSSQKRVAVTQRSIATRSQNSNSNRCEWWSLSCNGSLLGGKSRRCNARYLGDCGTNSTGRRIFGSFEARVSRMVPVLVPVTICSISQSSKKRHIIIFAQ